MQLISFLFKGGEIGVYMLFLLRALNSSSMVCFHFTFDKVAATVDGSTSSLIEAMGTLGLKMPTLAQVTMRWVLVWVRPHEAWSTGARVEEWDGKNLNSGIEDKKMY